MHTSEMIRQAIADRPQGWVFSRQRLYSVLQAGDQILTQPTACSRGLVARHAFAVGRDGIYFIGADGVYKTSGGPEESLSDQTLLPLFRGVDLWRIRPLLERCPERQLVAGEVLVEAAPEASGRTTSGRGRAGETSWPRSTVPAGRQAEP